VHAQTFDLEVDPMPRLQVHDSYGGTNCARHRIEKGLKHLDPNKPQHISFRIRRLPWL